MTIKEFSQLCGCNPQTLRYYDREDLLKPVKVDQWTGYRYYAEDQALTYVRIKNLQKAGFSIEEIKDLLTKDDGEIYLAFEKKIAAEIQKLEELKEIQHSYRTEMKDMKDKIIALQKTIKESMETYSPMEEFGISEGEYNTLKTALQDYFDQMLRESDYSKYELVDKDEDSEAKQKEEFEATLASAAMTTVFERHGWTNVRDFYKELPEIENGKSYTFLFLLLPEKVNNITFANTLLGILCMKNQDKHMNLKCSVLASEDGENHFWLREEK